MPTHAEHTTYHATVEQDDHFWLIRVRELERSTQARSLREADAAALWGKLLRLYEGGAHTALGYTSWGAYYSAEFGEDRSRGYQLLKAAEVRELIAQSTVVDSAPATESVARELVPVLKHNPDQVEEVWAQVVEEHDGFGILGSIDPKMSAGLCATGATPTGQPDPHSPAARAPG